MLPLAATGADGRKIVACLPPRTQLDEGAVCKLAVDPDSIHLFDTKTGLALERATGA
jgi:hypothetical protein